MVSPVPPHSLEPPTLLSEVLLCGLHKDLSIPSRISFLAWVLLFLDGNAAAAFRSVWWFSASIARVGNHHHQRDGM